MKKYLKKILDHFGLEIKRKIYQTEAHNNKQTNEDMGAGIKRYYSRVTQGVNTIIDIGAAEGLWSVSVKEFWPDANYVLFEPLEERKVTLQNLVKQNSKFHFVPKAAGVGKGEVNFYVAGDLDGSGVAQDTDVITGNIRHVDVIDVDSEVERLKLKGPYIIKLDTHGFEVPIIEGCEKIINDVSLFIIECYGFQIAKNSLLFWEMCKLMEDKGFRLIDIVDIMYRPKDQAFWQCDAFFIPKNSTIFNNNTYNFT